MRFVKKKLFIHPKNPDICLTVKLVSLTLVGESSLNAISFLTKLSVRRFRKSDTNCRMIHSLLIFLKQNIAYVIGHELLYKFRQNYKDAL